MNYHDIDVSCHSEFLFSNFVVLSSFLVIRNVTLYHIGVVFFFYLDLALNRHSRIGQTYIHSARETTLVIFHVCNLSGC